MLSGALILVLWLLHGGQYMPPVADPDSPTPLDGVVSLPGTGPELRFEADRWEWWFDFNRELLLRRRERLPLRAQAAGQLWQALQPAQRSDTVLPALVDAIRRRPSTEPGLSRILNSRDVRAAAVLSLGRLKRTDAVPYIEVVLEDDPDLFVRTQAVLALGFSGSPAAVETLARLYRSKDESVEIRTYAAAGLGLVGNDQAVDALREALDEASLSKQSNQLRAATVYAAGLSGDPVLAGALRDLLSTWLLQREPQLRALLGAALGRLGDPPSIAVLLELLDDADSQVRRSAAAGLEAAAAQLDATAVQRLIDTYRTEADALTRQYLLHALGYARSPGARAFLRAELDEAGYLFRPHVALALGIDGHPGSVSLLLERLDREREESARGALAVALGLLQAPEALEPLRTLFEEQHSPMLRGYIVLALGLIGSPQDDLVEQLQGLALEAGDQDLVHWAVIGIGLLGDPDRLVKLAGEVAARPGVVQRAAMLYALGLVGDARLVDPLLAVARDPRQTTFVRAYAWQALGELADPRSTSPAARLPSHSELSQDIGFLFELYRTF